MDRRQPLCCRHARSRCGARRRRRFCRRRYHRRRRHRFTTPRLPPRLRRPWCCRGSRTAVVTVAPTFSSHFITMGRRRIRWRSTRRHHASRGKSPYDKCQKCCPNHGFLLNHNNVNCPKCIKSSPVPLAGRSGSDQPYSITLPFHGSPLQDRWVVISMPHGTEMPLNEARPPVPRENPDPPTLAPTPSIDNPPHSPPTEASPVASPSVPPGDWCMPATSPHPSTTASSTTRGFHNHASRRNGPIATSQRKADQK